MAFQVACPHCNATIFIPDGDHPEEVTVSCGQCQRQVRARLPRVTGEFGGPLSHHSPSRREDFHGQSAPPAHEPTPVVGMLVDQNAVEPGESSNRGTLMGLLEPLLKTQNPTDVSLLLTSLIGGLATVTIYLAIIEPLKSQRWTELLRGDTYIPHAILFLTFWSVAILLLKFFKLLGQRKSLSYELLPVDGSKVIRRNAIHSLRNHIAELPLHQRRNFLVRRVLVALDHFEARGDVQEVGMALQTQGDIDGGRVDSSYTMVQVFIWAVPILGFIGTVVGIGQAVDGFSSSLQNADELDAIKESLTQVTSGLATAFNTTLIALVMSIIIMFPTNSLQKAEEDLLGSIEQYCNDHLLPRLQDEDDQQAIIKATQALEAQVANLSAQLARGSFSASVGPEAATHQQLGGSAIVGQVNFPTSDRTARRQ